MPDVLLWIASHQKIWYWVANLNAKMPEQHAGSRFTILCWVEKGFLEFLCGYADKQLACIGVLGVKPLKRNVVPGLHFY